jgi:hypothetical protein
MTQLRESAPSGLLGTEELRDRVQRLAAISRASASDGEARAAALIAAELEEVGARVRLESERVHGTYWWPVGVPAGAAALASVLGRRTAAVVGALAAAVVADDLALGRQWLRRRLLPGRTATNVVAELGDPGAPRTLLVVAHHDAAHSGLVFHPELARALFRRFPALLERVDTTPPTMWGAIAGPALVALGALAGRRRIRLAGGALCAGHVAAMLDIGRRPVVPGANDNASGVAVLLSIARSLAAQPPPNLRVVLLSTGSEESFMEGMLAFARRHFAGLPTDRTHVVCVDTVGSPHLLLLEGEGMVGIREYPKDFLALIRRCAEDLDVFLWPNLRFRNATDGVVALKAGYPSAMLGSVDRFKIPTDYHWPTDTADRVNYDTVADAARLVDGVARRLAAGAT